MQSMISLLYLLFFLGVVVTGLFVVYHISKYSLSRQNAYWGNMVFVSVLALLLFINVALFVRINWNGIVFEQQAIQKQTNIW